MFSQRVKFVSSQERDNLAHLVKISFMALAVCYNVTAIFYRGKNDNRYKIDNHEL